MKGKEDPRLKRFTDLCLALPEVTWEYTGQHGLYRIRKAIFAYYLEDHHGDGKVAFNCKAPPGENELLVKMDPEHYFIPPFVGPKGWIGMRLDQGKVDWKIVAGHLALAYKLTAPKKLSALV